MMRHVVLVALLTVVGLGGVLWQVDRSEAVGQRGELPKLICPLH
jgi:hypothetical protein